MGGGLIPPLIGLCAKPSSPVGGPPVYLLLDDPMIQALFGIYTNVPPVLVVYDKKDKSQLGKLYKEHILHPVFDYSLFIYLLLCYYSLFVVYVNPKP